MLVSCQPAPPFASTSQHFYQPVHPDAQALLPFLPFDSKPFSATDDHTDAGREILRSKRFACTFEGCGKTYARPGRLEEHVRSHTGERPFQCRLCSSNFGRSSHLIAHMRSHQTDGKKEYPCDECERVFWTNQHLKKHKDLHDPDASVKTYNCLECGDRFRKHHMLRTHSLQVHATPGSNPFPCEHEGCERTFKQSVHLKAHIKTHDLTRYMCSHVACLPLPLEERQYPNWSALQKHSKSAHPPRCPYPECAGKKFTTHRGLKGHLDHHKGVEGTTRKRRSRRKRKRSDEEETEETETTAIEDTEEGETEAEYEVRMESERDERLDVVVAANKSKSDNKKRKLVADSPWACDVGACRKKFKSAGALEQHVARTHHALPSPLVLDDPMPSTPTQLQRPPSPRKDKATVPLLDLLTGHNYAPASASHPSSSTRTIPCPYPDILDLVEEERAGDVQHPPCGYWFGRIYDLERHLKGTHGLVVERDELEEYMESKGVAIV